MGVDYNTHGCLSWLSSVDDITLFCDLLHVLHEFDVITLIITLITLLKRNNYRYLFHDCTQTYVDNAVCSGITGRSLITRYQ